MGDDNDERTPIKEYGYREGSCCIECSGGYIEWWLRVWVRILALLVGVSLFLVGGLQLSHLMMQLSLEALESYIIAFYLVVFGLVIILCEIFTTQVFYKYVAVMFTWYGRGIFYLFTGSICFGLDLEEFPLALVFGFAVGGVGLFLIFLGVVLRNAPGPQPLFPACACCGEVPIDMPPPSSNRSRGYDDISDDDDDEEMLRRERRRR